MCALLSLSFSTLYVYLCRRKLKIFVQEKCSTSLPEFSIEAWEEMHVSGLDKTMKIGSSHKSTNGGGFFDYILHMYIGCLGSLLLLSIL